jgi:hypothetical protein
MVVRLSSPKIEDNNNPPFMTKFEANLDRAILSTSRSNMKFCKTTCAEIALFFAYALILAFNLVALGVRCFKSVPPCIAGLLKRWKVLLRNRVA